MDHEGQHGLAMLLLQAAGGRPVEDRLAPDYIGKRADMLFEADRVIVEVKSLTSDRAQAPQIATKLGALFARSLHLGAPVIREKTRIGLHDLPPVLARRALRVIGARVRKEAARARDQIAATRVAIGMPDAFGLLLLISPPQRIGQRSMAWLVADLREQGGDLGGLDGILMIETALAAPEDFPPTPSFLSFWTVSGRHCPPALADRLDGAWGAVTGEVGRRADVDDFVALGASE